MRTLHKITAALLLALWLVVTQHAALEMAGVIPGHDHVTATNEHAGEKHHNESHHDESGAQGNGHAGWHVAEKTAPKPAVQILKAPTPVLWAFAFVFTFLITGSIRESTLTSVAKVAFERPRAWLPRWQFVRRAAPVSRAPSAIAV